MNNNINDVYCTNPTGNNPMMNHMYLTKDKYTVPCNENSKVVEGFFYDQSMFLLIASFANFNYLLQIPKRFFHSFFFEFC